MEMGKNGNGLYGNGSEWECKKPFPVISTPPGYTTKTTDNSIPQSHIWKIQKHGKL